MGQPDAHGAVQVQGTAQNAQSRAAGDLKGPVPAVHPKLAPGHGHGAAVAEEDARVIGIRRRRAPRQEHVALEVHHGADLPPAAQLASGHQKLAALVEPDAVDLGLLRVIVLPDGLGVVGDDQGAVRHVPLGIPAHPQAAALGIRRQLDGDVAAVVVPHISVPHDHALDPGMDVHGAAGHLEQGIVPHGDALIHIIFIDHDLAAGLVVFRTGGHMEAGAAVNRRGMDLDPAALHVQDAGPHIFCKIVVDDEAVPVRSGVGAVHQDVRPLLHGHGAAGHDVEGEEIVIALDPIGPDAQACIRNDRRGGIPARSFVLVVLPPGHHMEAVGVDLRPAADGQVAPDAQTIVAPKLQLGPLDGHIGLQAHCAELPGRFGGEFPLVPGVLGIHCHIPDGQPGIRAGPLRGRIIVGDIEGDLRGCQRQGTLSLQGHIKAADGLQGMLVPAADGVLPLHPDGQGGISEMVDLHPPEVCAVQGQHIVRPGDALRQCLRRIATMGPGFRVVPAFPQVFAVLAPPNDEVLRIHAFRRHRLGHDAGRHQTQQQDDRQKKADETFIHEISSFLRRFRHFCLHYSKSTGHKQLFLCKNHPPDIGPGGVRLWTYLRLWVTGCPYPEASSGTAPGPSGPLLL